ncbi:type I-E CRISPR-associated protein Cas6/Cse3/CasE [Marinactinospora rubrisoli]|uniref:Type I-E CRISPR-associated protein Cas6/Cse3/CasE n=1 Tax=Marinactinospora rubrisoli TaxID=2715399 RepID=A0ABW2KIW2_9ACTN
MTLGLTRIVPNPRCAEARADLGDMGALHRRLMRLLPPTGLGPHPRQAADLLFRVEQTRAGTSVLVQANRPLDTSGIPEGYGTVDTRDLTPLLDCLAAGLLVRYRIVASPTRRIGGSKDRGKTEVTTPLRGAEADAWWRQRAEGHGLRLHSLVSLDRADAVDRSRGRRIRHASVLFQGTAEVMDADALRSAVRTGIGRGKSHGCGLLSLAVIGRES